MRSTVLCFQISSEQTEFETHYRRLRQLLLELDIVTEVTIEKHGHDFDLLIHTQFLDSASMKKADANILRILKRFSIFKIRGRRTNLSDIFD
jgi:hypothetical protein